MKITVINGSSIHDSNYDSLLEELISESSKCGDEFEVYTLRELNLDYCTGCWSCWVKTPGECIFKDDTEQIRKSIINSDFVVFVSPLDMGYPTQLIKMVQDKLIPLVHPYIELVNNECHHIGRYTKYPEIGLVYFPEPETDEEDLEILKDLFTRFALNFKTDLALFEDLNKIKKFSHEATVN